MNYDSLEATVISNIRVEKDPDECLVYNVVGPNGEHLAQERIIANWAMPGKKDDTLTRLARRSNKRLCADGDSWINIWIEFSRFFGYNRTFFDILEGLYTTASTARPGDTFATLLQQKRYRQNLLSGSFDFFIFSGGGNDILGGGALAKILKNRIEGGESADAREYLDLERIDRVLDRLKDGYSEIAAFAAKKSPRTRMLVHGYDYPQARPSGIWLGKPFVAKNFDLMRDRTLITTILRYLVDRFYQALDDVAYEHPNVTVVNLRNTVKGRWADELHPKVEASIEIAANFRSVIDAAAEV